MNRKKTQKYEPRKLMELAIEVMRRTVSEPRKDGKVSPRERRLPHDQ